MKTHPFSVPVLLIVNTTIYPMPHGLAKGELIKYNVQLMGHFFLNEKFIYNRHN